MRKITRNKIAVIVPTRGDRPEFLNHCLHLIDEQTLQPEAVYVVDDTPRSNAPDLTWRVRQGVAAAKADGMDTVFIMEDDDYYPPNYLHYFENRGNKLLAIGNANSFYYHIGKRAWVVLKHENRSALFTSAFKIELFDGYPWPADDHVNLDWHIWDWISSQSELRMRAHISNNLFITPGTYPIGIKHGIGKCGGIGHTTLEYEHKDPGLFQLLPNIAGHKSLKFYMQLAIALKHTNP